MWGRNYFSNGEVIPNINIQFIGDPHLGRSFKVGTPLDRIGDRESMQWSELSALLNTEADLTVIMGDLYDKFNVDGATIIRTAIELATAAAVQPNRKIVIIKGNHDVSRDATKRSAFDILTHIVKHPNVLFVNQIESITHAGYRLLFVPYDVFATGEEYLSDWMDSQWDGNPYAGVFGHWDLDVINGKAPHNLIPINELDQLTNRAFTGHIHTPEMRSDGELAILGTGSMQPYAHGEGEEFYVTYTPQQIETLLATEGENALHNKAVRVLLPRGESLPVGLDCLQLTAKYVSPDGEEDSLDVELLEFDMSQLLKDSMLEEGVIDPTVIEDVCSEYHKLREETLC